MLAVTKENVYHMHEMGGQITPQVITALICSLQASFYSSVACSSQGSHPSVRMTVFKMSFSDQCCTFQVHRRLLLQYDVVLSCLN